MAARRLGLFGAVVVTATCVLGVTDAAAQGCPEVPTSGRRATWEEGTNVTVYVDPTLPGWSDTDYQNVLKGVFSRWEGVGGSGVTFTVFTDGSRAQNPPADSIGIVPGSSSTHGGSLGVHSRRSSHITLNDFSANPESMRNPLSHEIGHSFGLEHCPHCPSGTSVMASGGTPGPTRCDRQAVKENGNYTGIDPPDWGGGGGGGERPGPDPDRCAFCGVDMVYVTTQVCTEWTREGREGHDHDCSDPVTHGIAVSRWCCSGGGETAASEGLCGSWNQVPACGPDTTCCVEPPTQPTCGAYDLFDVGQQADCEASCGQPCEETSIVNWDCGGGMPCTVGYCLGCPPPSCGAMGGGYCSQSGYCPDGYRSLDRSSDCSPCCVSETTPGCQSTGCPPGSCGVQTDNCGEQVWCGECGPSCGEMGGDYCSPIGSCPPGYDSLGDSYDCNPCCQSQPSCGAMGGDYCGSDGVCPPGFDSLGASFDCSPCCRTAACASTGCPSGSCGWQTDNCGAQLWCGDCAPSCGAMGGDYCGAGGSCPPGFDSLGDSSDCNPCCRTAACQSSGCPAGSCGWQTDNCGAQLWCGDCAPSCGEMGGEYCSQSGGCPEGFDSIGPSSDCNPCCVSIHADVQE
jgi:hypothetical protein